MEANIEHKNNNSFIMWLIFSLIVALSLLGGCSPKINTVYVDRWHVRDSITYDSVYIQKTDSFIREIKGDSVYITKIKFQDRYKIKVEKVYQKDTVSRIVEKPVKVEKVVKVRDSIWWIGMSGLILFFLALVYKLYRFFK
jgi:hypothetical protein